MKAGRLSYTVDDAGERRIDTAELYRVFGTKMNGASGGETTQRNVTQAGELAALQRLLDEREETIRDLRSRLDMEAEERRRMSAVLMDQRAPWWRRLFR